MLLLTIRINWFAVYCSLFSDCPVKLPLSLKTYSFFDIRAVKVICVVKIKLFFYGLILL